MHSKIFTACFLGAFIGALVALQLQPQLWWIGLVVGGFTGYLSYEFKAVMRAIPTAYRATRGWRPDYEFWKVKARNMGIFLGITQSCLVVFFLIPAHSFSVIASISSEMWRAIGLAVIMMHVFMGLVGLYMPARDRDGEFIYMPMDYSATNPVAVLLWKLPRGIFYAVTWLIPRIPGAAMVCLQAFVAFLVFTKRFAVALFREVHSDARLLCACDASIGAAIGYFTGNAVIGGIAGGIFGVLNYEVVSKRLLHIEVRR